MSTLTAERVHEVLYDCFFENSEDREDVVDAHAAMLSFRFHQERLDSHREEIFAMLLDLPGEFMAGKWGGGSTFLYAVFDKNGVQWTASHNDVDALLALGLAIGKIEYCAPRECWLILPGGVPYFRVIDK